MSGKGRSGTDVPASGAGVSADVIGRARRVRLVTCDVDGVLTDGRVYVDDHGHESKAFCALDGVGLGLLARAGIAVGWITGSSAPSVAHRARQLGIVHLAQDARDKLGPWQHLRRELGLAPGQCAHIGDDLPDLPLLAACGFAVTVPDAVPPVLASAHYVTRRRGGHGAVREVADLILGLQQPGAGEAR